MNDIFKKYAYSHFSVYWTRFTVSITCSLNCFRCGTRPYLAPEVLKGPYRAQPADLWSCGIVFVAMLTGGKSPSKNVLRNLNLICYSELPWSEPFETNEEFSNWLKDEYLKDTPWSKLGNTALSLARQILNVDPKKRLTLPQIQNHNWMKFDFGNGKNFSADFLLFNIPERSYH